MSLCEFCGNHAQETFQITIHDRIHEFDCFQCAIQALAPTCSSCSCRILGQGVRDGGLFYCGPHCLKMAGQRLYTEEFNPMP